MATLARRPGRKFEGHSADRAPVLCLTSTPCTTLSTLSRSASSCRSSTVRYASGRLNWRVFFGKRFVTTGFVSRLNVASLPKFQSTCHNEHGPRLTANYVCIQGVILVYKCYAIVYITLWCILYIYFFDCQ